ncbi:MAG: hydroxyethylthiazole kinase [Actinobacteria bacterium]|nr:hydroxyethylthiazole kinase [Actinomycetota bacterium]
MQESARVTADGIWTDVEAVRSQAPLVHNITNYVVMNSTANALLAIGASPVMAHAVDEAADMVGIAGALVVNIGTLSPHWVEAMHVAMRAARDRSVPIVLDPVGAGATPYRTRTVHDLIADVAPTIVRGNASEIMALATAEATTKGVDSSEEASSAVDAATQLSRQLDAVVAVTGATDVIVDGDNQVQLGNGHPLMARVTGLGCTMSALSGAFAAVNPDPALAAAHALVVGAIAGELAAEHAEGPGTLQLHLLDRLHDVSCEQIADRLRVSAATSGTSAPA